MEEKKQSLRRKDYSEEIEIPAEIEAKIEGSIITMKKNNQELSRKISPAISIKKEGNKIILEVKKARKKEKKEFGTAKSHIKNMIEGLMKGYEYELEVCTVHFPMTVTFDKAKKEFVIKNLLGEKVPRIVSAADNVEVEIKMPYIKIKSHDLEAAGQTAANLEKVTRIRYRDRNKFQDGIFIIKKPGRIFV